MSIRRGDIYLAALDPVVGHEIAKTRPVLVVSNNLNNTYGGTVTVLPITSGNLAKIYPFEVFLKKGVAHLPKDSKIKADQIRTLDKARLVKHIGSLMEDDVGKVEEAMRIHLGM